MYAEIFQKTYVILIKIQIPVLINSTHIFYQKLTNLKFLMKSLVKPI